MATYGKLPGNADEIGPMFQGLGPDSYIPTGTNPFFFIDKKDIPKNKKPTYVRVVCADRPKKTNPKRVGWTAGGDKVKYTGNVTTQTADIQTAKCLFNSVVSTPNGRFMTLDLKDFYLCSDLPDYEYVRIPTHMLPLAIVELYQLESKISNGYVYAEVRKVACMTSHKPASLPTTGSANSLPRSAIYHAL
jgi:hypothetical protein